MQVEKRDGSKQRLILTAMLVDDQVLGRIAAKWDEGMFKAKWCNLIGKWCVDYHERYGKAPGKQVEGLFATWADKHGDPDTIDLVEKFLTSLSGKYKARKKQLNADYVVDLAGTYFNKVRWESFIEKTQGAIAAGDLEEADKLKEKFERVELGNKSYINFFSDKQAVYKTFAKSANEVLIEYGGALGKFFGDLLSRDNFIAFEGPEKRGKTFWLQEMAWRGVTQGRRVAFFEIGDLSEDQIMERLVTRAAGRPYEPTSEPILYPVALSRTKRGMKVSEREEISYEYAMSKKEAWKAIQAWHKKLPDKNLFRVETHPNDTLSISGLKAILRRWERGGWVPDIICLDYADLLASPPGFQGESRDAINKNWKGMRGLSQEYHCLLITASQTSAGSYGAKVISREHFSEDKRKRAHTTATIGINQDEGSEKEDQIQSLNFVVRRKGKYSLKRKVYVAGCLELAQIACVSAFRHEKNTSKKF